MALPMPSIEYGVGRLSPELVLQIVLLAVEETPPGFKHWPRRSKALLSLASISSSWRSWAQGELFKDVVLSTPERAAQFLAVAASDEELGAAVRTIRVGGDAAVGSGVLLEAAEAFQLGPLLRSCSGVTALRLERVREIVLGVLTHGQDLTDLSLATCTVKIAPEPEHTPPGSLPFDHDPPSLPSLLHLSISNVSFGPGTKPSLLSPTALPSLSALAFATGPQFGALPCIISHTRVRSNALRRFPFLDPSLDLKQAPILASPSSLRSLSTSSPLDASLSDSALTLLSLPAHLLTPLAIHAFPETLRTLRIVPGASVVVPVVRGVHRGPGISSMRVLAGASFDLEDFIAFIEKARSLPSPLLMQGSGSRRLAELREVRAPVGWPGGERASSERWASKCAQWGIKLVWEDERMGREGLGPKGAGLDDKGFWDVVRRGQ